MSKVRIHVEGEPGKAAADGIDAEYLKKWIDALTKAFASSTHNKPLKIVEVKAGSIDSTIASEPEPMKDFWRDLGAAAGSHRLSDANKQVRNLLDMLPPDKDQKFELLNDQGVVVDRLTAKARQRVSRTRPVPDAEIATFGCIVEEVICHPRAVRLYDLERERVVLAWCAPDLSRHALELTDRSGEVALIATVSSSPGKAADREHQLLALRTVDQQNARDIAVAERAKTWSVDDFLSRHPDAPKPPQK